jgi:hypothetical protein
MNWMVIADGQRLGPVAHEELVSWARAGRLKATDLVWREGFAQWVPAAKATDITSLVPVLAQTGPADLGDDAVMRALLPVGRSAWAIVAGYLGLFSVLVVPAPLAILAGAIAVRQIRRNPKLHGMGRAVFGIVMGILGSAVLAFIIFGSFKYAR